MAELYGDAAAVAKLAQALGASKEKAETSVRETLAKPKTASASKKNLTYEKGSLETMTVAQAKAAGKEKEYNDIVSGISGAPITTSEMAGSSVPPTIPTPPTTSNYTGVGAGANAYINSNPPPTPSTAKTAAQLYQENIAGLTPTDSTQLLKDMQEEADLKEKRDAARKLKARIDSINAQSEAAKRQLESEAGTGKDITGQFLGRQQQEIERQATIQTLPLTAEYQATLGDYQAARDTVNQLYTAKLRDLESQRDYKLKVYETAYQIASDAEKAAVRAQEIKDERAYQTQRDTIAFERDKELYKYKEDLENTGGGKTLDPLDVQRYNDLYPDAGITVNDTVATANAKVAQTNSPEGRLKSTISGFKDSNIDYKNVIKNINESTSITDKVLAKKIADEVYGKTEEKLSRIELDIQNRMNFYKNASKSVNVNEEIKSYLKTRGYTNSEIAQSSVSGFLDKTIDSINRFLFK